MPYVTSIERFGIEKGRQEGRQEGILQTARNNIIEVLKLRFKRVPQTLIRQIQAIEDEMLLSQLLQEAVLIDSVKSFKQLLEK